MTATVISLINLILSTHCSQSVRYKSDTSSVGDPSFITGRGAVNDMGEGGVANVKVGHFNMGTGSCSHIKGGGGSQKVSTLYKGCAKNVSLS